MTEQDSMRDERVARLIQAARELIDAYERKSTANEHFLKLEAAVDALGAWRHQRADTSRPRPGDPTDRGVATVDGCALHPTDRVVSDTPQGSGGRLEHRIQTSFGSPPARPSAVPVSRWSRSRTPSAPS